MQNFRDSGIQGFIFIQKFKNFFSRDKSLLVATIFHNLFVLIKLKKFKMVV